MAILLDDASSQYLIILSSVLGITDWPITLVCWMKTDESDNQAGMMFGDMDNGSNYMGMWYRDPADTDVIAHVYDGSSGYSTSASSYATDSSWQHTAAVFISDTSRYTYLDGVAGAVNTTNKDFSANYDCFVIGARRAGVTVDRYLSGGHAEAAVWNVALTAPEIASLAKGYSPLFIRPQNLVAYWPLIRNPKDIVGGYDLTEVNSPTYGAHPPIIYPVGQQIFSPSGVSSSTISVDINALLKKTGVFTSANIDSLLMKSFPITLSIDALLAEIRSNNISIDSLLKASKTSTVSIDSLLKSVGLVSTVSIDSLLQTSGILITSNLDAVLIESTSTTVSIDALLKEIGVSITCNVDALLQTSNQVTTAIDALLLKNVISSLAIDALLLKSQTTSGSMNALLQTSNTSITSIDSLLKTQDNIVTSVLDSLLQRISLVNTTSIDSLLKSSGVSTTMSIDSLLKTLGVSSIISIDSLLQTSGSIVSLIDAVLQEGFTTYTISIDIDTLLQISATLTGLFDAVLISGADYPRYIFISKGKEALLSGGVKSRSFTSKKEDRTFN